jgi:hypothetical protein
MHRFQMQENLFQGIKALVANKAFGGDAMRMVFLFQFQEFLSLFLNGDRVFMELLYMFFKGRFEPNFLLTKFTF